MGVTSFARGDAAANKFRHGAGYVDDFIAGGLLLYAARSNVTRPIRVSNPSWSWLWAVLWARLYGSFFGQLESSSARDVSGCPMRRSSHQGYLYAIALAGLVLSAALRFAKRAGRDEERECVHVRRSRRDVGMPKNTQRDESRAPQPTPRSPCHEVSIIRCVEAARGRRSLAALLEAQSPRSGRIIRFPSD